MRKFVRELTFKTDNDWRSDITTAFDMWFNLLAQLMHNFPSETLDHWKITEQEVGGESERGPCFRKIYMKHVVHTLLKTDFFVSHGFPPKEFPFWNKDLCGTGSLKDHWKITEQEVGGRLKGDIVSEKINETRGAYAAKNRFFL